MEQNVLHLVSEKINKEESVALITITKSIGSAPRKSGAIMAVWQDGIIGTIGGGKIENKVIQLTRELLVTGESQSFQYGLNNTDELGMTCGGQVEGYIKVFNPQPKIVIVGGGHVGKSLMKLCEVVGFNYVIIDDRPEFIENVPNGILGDMAEEVSKLTLNQNTYVVLVSRSNTYDRQCLAKIIERDIKYIGMLGSKKKVIEVRNYILEQGIDEKEFDKFYAPIGLKLSDGSPQEIAVEILAEILKIKNNGELAHRKLIIK